MKRNRKILVFIVTLIVSIAILSGCNQQEISSFTTINDSHISNERALAVIEELSSSNYNGRLVGTHGNKLAVEYIKNQFKEIGLKVPAGMDTYLQSFNHLHVKNNDNPSLRIVNEQGEALTKFNHLTDFIAKTGWPNTRINGAVVAPMLHINSESDLENLKKDFDGKVLLLDTDLVKSYVNKQFGLYDLTKKTIALNSNIKAIIVNCDYRRDGYYPVSKSLYKYVEENGSFSENGPMVIYCRAETFTSLKDAVISDNNVEINLNYELETCTSSNVIGVIEGSDENLKNNYIIIGAHLDHIGDNNDGTYNPGSLDNASGIAGLLEVARSLVNQEIAPKKTIVFIAFNAEEESLFGSRYYVKNPIYPLSKSTMINLDCLGSKDSQALGFAIAGNSGNKLSKELVGYAKGFSLKTYEFQSRSSDHAPFTQEGVPAVFLIHPEKIPRMHTVNDTVDKTIDINLLEDAVRVVLYYLDQNAY